MYQNQCITYQDYQGRLRNTIAERRLHCEHRQVRTILFDTIVLKKRIGKAAHQLSVK